VASRLTRGGLLTGAAGIVLARPLAAVARADAGVHRFVSRPDLVPPVLRVTRATQGLVFLAPSSGPGRRGALIVDGRGEPVWFHTPARGRTVADFKVQRLHGRPVLTWWEGKSVGGLADGEWVVVDDTYREVARFHAARGLRSDLHDFQLSPQGTALVTSNEVVGRVVGGVVQELALPSGRLLWEWRSLDHVPVTETMVRGKPGPQFDYFHINAIDVHPAELVVSARNTWAAYRVDRETGRVRQRLGGRRSDVTFGAGARFEWQHDVRDHGGGLVTVYDNAAAPAKEARSRALVLHLARDRATLVHAYSHPGVLAHYFGNAQLLDGGSMFVGWGGSPFVTEFAAAGDVTFDARLPRGGQSYRAFRSPWVGRPATKPAVAVRDGKAYASWNGATELVAWDVDGRRYAKTGFETELPPGARTTPVLR
jgi:hypothetical protein